MNRYLQSALAVAALGLASVTCALAQEDTAPPPASTAPSPSTSSTEPSTTEHSNRQASSKETQKQMMKDCVAKEQADNGRVTYAIKVLKDALWLQNQMEPLKVTLGLPGQAGGPSPQDVKEAEGCLKQLQEGSYTY